MLHQGTSMLLIEEKLNIREWPSKYVNKCSVTGVSLTFSARAQLAFTGGQNYLNYMYTSLLIIRKTFH